MEMCVDNPREGFADLFATHPSVDSRVEALVKFAGGHDPGPLALPSGRRRRAGYRTTDQLPAAPPVPGPVERVPATKGRRPVARRTLGHGKPGLGPVG
jgi:heat shock protein HtpX